MPPKMWNVKSSVIMPITSTLHFQSHVGVRLLHILLAILTISELGQETSINPFQSWWCWPFISVY
jgi:hypothetical protein